MATIVQYILFIVIFCSKLRHVASNFVNCAGDRECKDETKDDCVSGEDCVIDCTGTRTCDGATLICPTGHGCNITCSGDEACWGAVIQAASSSELYLKNCIGTSNNEFPCENIDVYCPSHQFGEPKCHISGNSNGLRHCGGCGSDPAGNNGLHFYAIYGFLDMDFSRWTGSSNLGTMHCLNGYTTSCSVGTDWTCSGNTNCDITLSPTTNTPTTDNPTTANPTGAPTTSNPTTSIPTTALPTTSNPSTAIPTTVMPTTSIPTTAIPTTSNPTTAIPTTLNPTTSTPTSSTPTTATPITAIPSTAMPTTATNDTKSETKLTLFANPESTKDTKVDDQMVDTTTITTTRAGVVDNNYNKEGIELFEMSIWMIVSIGLFIIIICIICFIVMSKCKKRNNNNKMRKEIRNNKLSNIQLTNTNNNGENGKQFGRIKSVSVDSPISKDVDNTDLNIKDRNEDEDEFIVEDGNNNHSMMTPTFPENKYIQNGNSDEFVVDEDDVVRTPQFPQNNNNMINNGNNDEFIVENNDENDIITPTFGENNYIINNENDNTMIIDGDDEDEHTEGDDNILEDIETFGAQHFNQDDNNNNNNYIMDAFTIN